MRRARVARAPSSATASNPTNEAAASQSGSGGVDVVAVIAPKLAQPRLSAVPVELFRCRSVRRPLRSPFS